ncbi:hypothetical protein MTR_3g009980 [Medicago truncatula]|uniref:Uncharacterized protein n=1 Tax=Medicago truncatula TaxID=3880 RepID=A0A072UU78_MEDTR|nr:hypothetical protein MTR_3g009980 [Medicago truncatula]
MRERRKPTAVSVPARRSGDPNGRPGTPLVLHRLRCRGRCCNLICVGNGCGSLLLGIYRARLMLGFVGAEPKISNLGRRKRERVSVPEFLQR